MLQGFPSHHTLAMPIWGFLRSALLSPTAWSMAWLAPWLAGSVRTEEYLLSLGVEGEEEEEEERDAAEDVKNREPGERVREEPCARDAAERMEWSVE